MGRDSPKSDASPYSYHTEPKRVGGAKYVRCEHCDREVIPADPDRLYHKAECPEADR